MKKYLLTLSLIILSLCARAQTAACDSIDLADTVEVCLGSTVTLNATVYGTNTLISRLWTPALGLSDATILNPVLTTTSSGYYKLTLRTLIEDNLVVNGDFSAGNTGFGSSYTFVTGPGSLFPEGTYAITPDPNDEHPLAYSFYDHTTGLSTGRMMAVNGASTPVNVWCQTISVSPNTYYDFAAWFSNWSSDTITNLPLIHFEVNGVALGSGSFTFPGTPGLWTQFSATWNSGASTSATICITDLQTALGGNDFAIDDVTFKQYCDVADSVLVDVNLPDTSVFAHDTSLCAYGFPIGLYSPSGYTSYTWSTGSGSSFGIPVSTGGTYWVRSVVNCEIRMDTFNVTSLPVPSVYLGHDTGFCIGNTYVLSSPQPTGSTWTWSTGSTSDTIHVSSSGTYSLAVTNSYGCSDNDAVAVLVSNPPVVNLGPDTTECNGVSFVLSSSVTYTAPYYLWQDYSIAPVLTATATGTYWLQVTEYGCSGADTIHVEIKYDTFTLYNPDTAICKGQSVQVRATADPEITFQWRPTAGIANSTQKTPLIKADTSAVYVVVASLEGCPDKRDSFYLDVQPNPDPFLGLNRHICEFDSVRIIGYVDPPWYTHYTYHWSPGTAVDDSTITAVIFRAGITTNIKLTVTTPAGCSGTDSAMMVVHPGNFAIGGGDTSLCPGESARIVAAGGVSYEWTPNSYLDDPGSASPIVKPEGDQSYSVVVTNEYGCRDTLSWTVFVMPAAVMNLQDSVQIFPGESYQISPETNGTKFTWTPSGGLNGKFISNPLATPEVSMLYRVQYVTEHGCRSTDSIYINVNENALVTVPNAFTPGAGANSKLYPVKRGLATLKSFRIYNRWGNLVFQSSGFDEGWDGTFKGVPQPLGVFVYTIEAESGNGRIFTKTGNVTLLR